MSAFFVGSNCIRLLDFPPKQLLLLTVLLLTWNSKSKAQIADTIYHNGTIITVDDTLPKADAVAVLDGKILAVGEKQTVLQARGDATKLIDLQGRTMLPGFVDAHGHVMGGGLQALSANLLAPPDGDVKDIASLQQTLRDWIADNREAVDKIQLVVGFGYDNAQLTELRHPLREELDAVSAEIPILLVHQSGHLISVNSKALEAGGITASTPDPPGGVIRRQNDGQEPNGVLEETAAFPLLAKLIGRVGEEGATTFIRAGADLWARFGYTTAQDGRSMPGMIQSFKEVAANDGLKIDVVSYPDILVAREEIKQETSSTYQNRFRVAGAKLTIDGSPQGFTAWRDRPYFDPVGDYPPGYLGYPAASAQEVADAIDWAFANDIQLLTHSNGEAASDQLIAFIGDSIRKHGGGDRRPVLIHGQFLREDQIDAFKNLGVLPSLFPMHTYYWGDWHREHTVGPRLADDISPTGWCVKRGMKFTTHHDAPVAFPNSMRVLDATVTRRSRSGDIIGPEHRVDVMTAIKAMTIWPAWQHFEEKTKGSIEVGKLADFVILDQDPTRIDRDQLDQIQILETIKEGVTVFALKNRSQAKTHQLHQQRDRASGAFTNTLMAISGVRATLTRGRFEPSNLSSAMGPACASCACGTLSWLAETAAKGNKP
ncbi:MAG: amidohydrolase [Planctomycetaceae bacterium]|nr:amidohydrolase [Planctomycetaceae bacterium]